MILKLVKDGQPLQKKPINFFYLTMACICIALACPFVFAGQWFSGRVKR